jgi:hypothetical protein
MPIVALATVSLAAAVTLLVGVVGGRTIAHAVQAWQVRDVRDPSWTNENPLAEWRGHALGFTDAGAIVGALSFVFLAAMLWVTTHRPSLPRTVAYVAMLYAAMLVALNALSLVGHVPVLHVNPLERRYTLDFALGVPLMHGLPTRSAAPVALTAIVAAAHLAAIACTAVLAHALGRRFRRE